MLASHREETRWPCVWPSSSWRDVDLARARRPPMSTIASRFPSRSTAGCRSRRRSPTWRRPHARAAHEPLVAGPLRAARVREERLRRARVRPPTAASWRRRRPDPYGWNVTGHGGSVTVKYKVFGDRVDGTYLAVDTTHAHINMPAAIMWARGLDDRPVDGHVRAAGRRCSGRSPRSCTPGSRRSSSPRRTCST